MFIILTDYSTNINIVLRQGTRGFDGNPGPQGVAGATVSFFNTTHAHNLTGNEVWLRCVWFNALFQGDHGQRGVTGELGPNGGAVSWHIHNFDLEGE